MSRPTDRPSSPVTPSPRVPAGLEGKVACPFCGTVRDLEQDTPEAREAPCPRCTMSDTSATRKATQARIGPWYVRQNRNPAAPGMRFDTLLALIRRGQVTPQSVVRGPTTHQLWRFAAQVKGVSREFGLCYNCGQEIDRTATSCGRCSRAQEPPANPDVLIEATGIAAPIQKEIQPSPASEPKLAAPEARRAQPPQRPSEPSGWDEVNGDVDLEPAPKAQQHQQRPAPVSPPAPSPRPSPAANAEEHRRPPRKSPARIPPSQRTEEILSAKDLAAAFQLELDPAAERRGPRPPRKRRVLRAVALLLLLGLAGVAVALTLRPDWRAEALATSKTVVESAQEMIRAFIAKFDAPERPAQPSKRAASTSPTSADPSRPDVSQATEQGPESTDPSSPQVPEQGLTLPDPVALAPVRTAAPADATQEARPSLPDSVPVRENALPEPTSGANADPRPSAPPRDDFVVPQDPALAYDTARVLWREALDAEARGDYNKAINTYEQIKKLPQDAWPAGLEINLNLARRRAQ